MQTVTPRYAVLKAGLAIIIYIALANVLTLALGAVFSVMSGNGFSFAAPQLPYALETLANTLISAVSMAVPVVIFTRNAPGWETKQPSRIVAVYALPAFLTIFCLGNLLSNWLYSLFSGMGLTWQSQDFSHSWDSPLNAVVSVVAFALVPAFFEELLFRGAVLKCLQPCGERVAVFLSAILFTAMHNNPAAWPAIFLLGVLFAFVDIRTGSLLPSMLLHLLNNGIAVLSEYLATLENQQYLSWLVIALYAGGTLFLFRFFTVRAELAEQLKLTRGDWSFGRAMLSPAVLIILAYAAFAVVITAQRV